MKITAGKSVILDRNRIWSGIVNSQDEVAVYNTVYLIGDSAANVALNHLKNISQDGIELKGYQFSTDDPEYSLTEPATIQIGEKVDVRYYFYWDIIYNTKDTDIPDKLFEMFVEWIDRDSAPVEIITYTNTDGNSQDIIKCKVVESSLGTGQYITSSVIFEGTSENFRFENAGGISRARNFYYAVTSKSDVYVNVIFEAFNFTNTYKFVINYAPVSPTVSQIIKSDGKYLRISSTLNKFHGNIYYNGGAEPEQEYIVDGNTNQGYIDIKLEKAGAYTANIISEVNSHEIGYPLYAYSQISNTLIVDVSNEKISISFNEYTGVLTATCAEGSVSNFKLQKYIQNNWTIVETNTTGIFNISEDGTYKVAGDANVLYIVEESDEITIGITLETPNVYVDYSNPSQLGFDEVPNASEYDIYKLNEDGSSELYETVSSRQSNSLRSFSVNRKLKIFNVVTK